MKNKPLSEAMQRCLDYVKAHDGYIHRHNGGFWARKDWQGLKEEGGVGKRWFCTHTITALVARGRLEYVGKVQSGPGYGQPQGAKLVT